MAKSGTQRKPETLIYGVNEVPPHAVTLLNALQHVGVVAVNFIYPVLIFRAAGASPDTITSLLALGFAILGLTTLMQVAGRGPVGTGYLCPTTFTATYLAPSLLAARSGGLALVFGMTVFAGLLEAALARILQRLRAVMPVEISGLVIVLIGLTAGLVGVRTLLGAGEPVPGAGEWVVAALTLGATIAFYVWGKGLVRMLCALIGMGIGYGVAAVLGVLSAAELDLLARAAWVGLPALPQLSLSFDATLALPFAIAAVAAAMKAVGTLTVCQRTNDANWVRADNASNARGVTADGLGSVLSGLLGGVGVNTSTPSVGLAAATGVASRTVAYAVAAIFLLLALMPKVAAIFEVMPRAVMAGALVFAACFIVINGVQVLTSRLLDSRRTLTLGLGLIAAAAVEAVPALSAGAEGWVRPIIGSSLVFGTFVALTCNLLFRIGVRQSANLAIDPAAFEHKPVEDFLKRQGARWGARPDIVTRAVFGAVQLVEAVIEHGHATGKLKLTARFDEFDFDIRLSYAGTALPLPDRRPSIAEIRDAPDGAQRLAGYMIRRNADRVRIEEKDGQVDIWFHLDH